MVIRSKNNPQVRELAALKHKKGRRESGAFLVEGGKMVRECMAAQTMRVRRLILREDCAEAARGPGDVVLGAEAFAAVCDEKTPQGIAAEVELPAFALRPPRKRCLLLDGLQDPSNVGAIVRTAVAAGYDELFLADCADPYSPKSVRASMSGVFFARLMQGTRAEIFEALGDIPLLAADMRGEDAFAFSPPDVFCLAVGNEGRGLSEEVRRRARHFVRIPMDARCESLNAAVSAGILMYALRRR